MIDYFIKVTCSLCGDEEIVEGMPTDTAKALRAMSWAVIPLYTGGARHLCPACASDCLEALRAGLDPSRPSDSPVGVS